MRIPLIALGLVVLSAAGAAAQQAGEPRFSVTVNGGIGTGGNRTGGALGGSVGVAIAPRFTGEFETVYADRGPGVTALSLEGRLQISLMPPGSRIVPQAIVGGGAYRTSFDFDERSFAMALNGRPVGGTTWMASRPANGYHGSMWTVVNPNGVMMSVNMPQVPMFYAQRMGQMGFGTSLGMRRPNFTDPALIFGGGVTINATRRLFVRPEARALMVIGDGDTYTLGFFTARVGVRF